MGKMEETLRSEIGRLSRKEIRGALGPLKNNLRDLKRAVADVSKRLGKLEKTAGAPAKPKASVEKKLAVTPEEVNKARISAGLIKKLRKRLAITQSELAELLDVSPTTVAFWEQGRTRPTESSKAGIVGLRKLGRRDIKQLLAAREVEAS